VSTRVPENCAEQAEDYKSRAEYEKPRRCGFFFCFFRSASAHGLIGASSIPRAAVWGGWGHSHRKERGFTAAAVTLTCSKTVFGHRGDKLHMRLCKTNDFRIRDRKTVKVHSRSYFTTQGLGLIGHNSAANKGDGIEEVAHGLGAPPQRNPSRTFSIEECSLIEGLYHSAR